MDRISLKTNYEKQNILLFGLKCKFSHKKGYVVLGGKRTLRKNHTFTYWIETFGLKQIYSLD